MQGVCARVFADLLQDEEVKDSPPWHTPFHRAGTGPSPWSLKLFDSGQMPANTNQDMG